MALESIGLGGVLKFDEKQAVRGMTRASGAANRFGKSFNRLSSIARNVGRAVGQMAGSMRNLGLASLPATAALGFATKKAIDFEKQMSAVRAITQGSTEDMASLTREAKKQGATTAFSATEAAQGMEFLSRAGFNAEQQIAAIGPVLNAAAADGIDLATAADIVANSVKAMGLEAKDASRVADVFAVTSAKSNTNITALGEAMKFAAPQAKTLGIDLETTAAILGSVADAGLRGSIGGTSFTQALVKLAKPTSQGKKILADFNVTMTKTASGGLDVVDVFRQINEGLQKETDVVERARLQTEIFGIRGQKAFTAVAGALDRIGDDGTNSLERLIGQLREADGAAKRMADIRLDNLAGAFTLLKSATEGFALETAGLFLGPMSQGVQGFTSRLSNVVLVLQELNSEQGLTEETAGRVGTTIVAVAKGIKEGFDVVINAFVTFRTGVTEFMRKFVGGQAPDMIQKFTKIAVIIGVVLAAVAPLLIAIGGIAFFVTTVLIPGFSALGTVFGVVFSGPVLIAIGVLIAAFALFRNEGESIGNTFTRLKDIAIGAFNFIMEAAINPFIESFQSMPNVFDRVLVFLDGFAKEMKKTFGDLIGIITQTFEALKPVTQAVWSFIGGGVSILASVIATLFTGILAVTGALFKVIVAGIGKMVEGIVNFIKGTVSLAVTFADFVGFDVSDGLREFAAGEFKIKFDDTTGTRGTGLPPGEDEPLIGDIADSLAALSAETQAGKLDQTISDQSIDGIKTAVAGAIAETPGPEINLESKLICDGAELARASGKHSQEVKERSGSKAVPWQRKIGSVQGVSPTGSGRG